MKRKPGWNNAELKPRAGLYPFDDVVDIQDQIASTIACFNNSQTVNMIVVPGHLVKLRICPNSHGHVCAA